MEDRLDFADFYCSNYSSAVHYARIYIFDEEEARDIVSEAFVRLMELGEKLDCNKNVYAFFISIVHSRCLDYLRRMERRRKVEDNIRQSADRFSDDEFRAMCHKELFRMVGCMLDGMPNIRRKVYCEVHFDGHSRTEVAKTMNVMKRVVEYQLRRAEECISTNLRRMYG